MFGSRKMMLKSKTPFAMFVIASIISILTVKETDTKSNTRTRTLKDRSSQKDTKKREKTNIFRLLISKIWKFLYRLLFFFFRLIVYIFFGREAERILRRYESRKPEAPLPKYEKHETVLTPFIISKGKTYLGPRGIPSFSFDTTLIPTQPKSKVTDMPAFGYRVKRLKVSPQIRNIIFTMAEYGATVSAIKKMLEDARKYDIAICRFLCYDYYMDLTQADTYSLVAAFGEEFIKILNRAHKYINTPQGPDEVVREPITQIINANYKEALCLVEKFVKDLE